MGTREPGRSFDIPMDAATGTRAVESDERAIASGEEIPLRTNGHLAQGSLTDAEWDRLVAAVAGLAASKLLLLEDFLPWLPNGVDMALRRAAAAG